MTDVQWKIYEGIREEYCIHRVIDANAVLDRDVLVIAEHENHLYIFTIAPDGDATRETFSVTRTDSYYGWSMEANDWFKTESIPAKEESGDEPFDVAVNKIILEENKMKEIKGEKKMINFNSLYKEAYTIAFRDYVRESKEELTKYAEETANEKIIEHINDNVDFEDVAHNIIDEMIDYYIEYDGEADDDDLEQIICDYIFE